MAITDGIETWITVGSFFSSADVGATSATDYRYVNKVTNGGIIAEQKYVSNSNNPHPDANLSSHVFLDDGVFYRKGGPFDIVFWLDTSNNALVHTLSELPLTDRNCKVSFDLYIPSYLDTLNDETSTTHSAWSESPFTLPWVTMETNTKKVTGFTIRYSGGVVKWADENPTPNAWHHLEIYYDHTAKKTNYIIDGVQTNGKGSANNIATFFANSKTGGAAIKMYCNSNSLRDCYMRENGLKLANLVIACTDYVDSDPPEVTVTETRGGVGFSVITAEGVADSRLPDSSVTYLWETGETTPSITVTEDGDYTVTVADSVGASTTFTATIKVYRLQYPLQASYSVSSEPSIVRTAMYDGRSRQRIMGGGRKCKTLKCQFLMSEEQLSSWLEKWRTELHEGADWFSLQVLGDDDFIETKTVRLKKGEWTAKLKFRSATDTMYDVSMNFEVK